MSNGTVITGNDIDTFRIATIIRALRLEIETGMKISRISILKVVQRDYGVKAKNKRAALAELLEKFPQFA